MLLDNYITHTLHPMGANQLLYLTRVCMTHTVVHRGPAGYKQRVHTHTPLHMIVWQHKPYTLVACGVLR